MANYFPLIVDSSEQRIKELPSGDNLDLTGNSITSVRNIIPETDSTYNLGSPSKKWNELYLSGSTIFIGNATISVEGTNIQFGIGESVSTISVASNDTFVSLAATQTVTNKTISGSDNTLTNIGNSSLTNSSVTINGSEVSLGGTASFGTDSVSEGTTNLYFTQARARQSVSVSDTGGDGSLSYDNTTGVITYTGPSASEVRAHLSSTAETGITYNNTTGVFALSSVPNSSLSNNNITLGSTSVNLGATATTLAGLTSVTSTTFVGALTGNASTSTKLATARTITLSGDISGSASFDGSENVTITASVGANSVTLGTDTAGDYVASLTSGAGITVGTASGEGSTPVITNTGVLTVVAGNAITVSGAAGDVTINHADTSSVSNVSSDNSGSVVIQDVSLTFDTHGHVTGATVGTVDLDDRYYTETEADSRFVNTAGDTMTGFLTLHSEPTSSSHAATKQYVDEIAEGLITKPAVEIATTANLTATYDNGTGGVGATLTASSNGAFPTIDGVTLTSTFVGENGVLVKNQSNSAQNGRYNLTQVGDASNPWILTRCGLCDESSEIPGIYTFVKQGTLYAGTGWVQTVSDPSTFTIGTDSILVTQFSGAGTFTAGTGLVLNGTQFAHDDTSSVENLSSDNSGNTFIQDISLTFDTFGHVTGATVATGNVSVGDGTLTLATSGIATGSQSFTANQNTNATFTVDVPGTNISEGTRTSTSVPINSSTGTGATLSSASTSLAGVMSSSDKTKLDGIETGAQVNVATNLGYTTATSTGSVTSSTGSSATIPAATTSLAGLLTSSDKTKLDGIANNATANTGTVTSVAGTGTVSGLTLSGTVTTSGNLTLGGTLSVSASNFSSQAANTFLSAPNGTSGVPTFRTILASDIPTLNQNTTGTAANVTGTVAVLNGGTGATTASQARINLSAQEILVSGTNIKTINSESILGTGNITLSTNLSGLTDVTITSPSTGQVLKYNGSIWVNDADAGGISLTDLSVSVGSASGSGNLSYNTTNGTFTFTPADLSTKQDTLVSGTNIKTVNNESILGSGNITISGGGGGGATIATKSDNVEYKIIFTDETSSTQENAYINADKLFFNPSTGQLNATILNSLSDVNHKTNIVPITEATTTIQKLNGVEFEWKDTGNKSAGVIAQELEKILPHLVDTSADGLKSVNYSGITGYLIEAIKEQQKQIDELKKYLTK
jgi:hypothetical protein